MWNVFVAQLNKGAYKFILNGLLATLEIAIFGLLIGLVIGTVLAVIRVMPKYKRSSRFLDFFAKGYITLFRGTPIVVQLLIGYYVLFPLLNINLSSLYVAIIIFGMNSGAYISEIMRSGIQSVDAGQLEAGRAVGLPYSVAMMKIVIPQAIKNILPTLGNEFIALIKETSVASFIAVLDLTKAFQMIGGATYEYMVPYLMLAVVYLVLVMLITLLIRIIEKRLKKSER